MYFDNNKEYTIVYYSMRTIIDFYFIVCITTAVVCSTKYVLIWRLDATHLKTAIFFS